MRGLILNKETPDKTVDSTDICMYSYWQLCTWILTGKDGNLTPSQNILIISFLVRIKWTVTLSWPACQAVHLFPSSLMSQGTGEALITMLAAKRITTPGSNLITFTASQLGARAAQNAPPSERDIWRRIWTMFHVIRTVVNPVLSLHNTACIGWVFPQSSTILPCPPKFTSLLVRLHPLYLWVIVR